MVSLTEYVQPVDVLDGNVISCSTLPPNDNYLSTYVCGSSNLEFSLYYWLSFFVIFISSAYVIHAHHWWDNVSTTTMYTEDVKVKIPKTVQLLSTMKRFQFFSGAIVIMIVVSQLLIYPSLKAGPMSANFRTHSYQYQYWISGAFLKHYIPAICLIILYVLVFIGDFTICFCPLFIKCFTCLPMLLVILHT